MTIDAALRAAASGGSSGSGAADLAAAGPAIGALRAVAAAAPARLPSGTGGALVTIVAATGSTPRGPGSRMLVREDGSIVGTVGGGQPEARAIEAALDALAEGRPRVLLVEMTGAEARGSDLICGGSATMWIEPLSSAARRTYAAAVAAVDRGGRAALAASATGGVVAAMDEGGAALVHGATPVALDAAALARALESGECVAGEADGLLYFPLEPAERLLVLGGGHVGRALARAAVELGFSVTVADPRPEFSDPARFPETVACVRSDFVPAIEGFGPGPGDYAVVVSPGHLGDLDCARALLGRRCRYVGVIGSRRKAAMIIGALVDEGFDRGEVESLRLPIGIDIGSQTPEEIAISIAAELVAVRREAACLAPSDADRRARRRGPLVPESGNSQES